MICCIAVLCMGLWVILAEHRPLVVRYAVPLPLHNVVQGRLSQCRSVVGLYGAHFACLMRQKVPWDSSTVPKAFLATRPPAWHNIRMLCATHPAYPFAALHIHNVSLGSIHWVVPLTAQGNGG